ncbi:hypothetical protein Hoch_3968 [Haliangium ochraceum DSM 14365]|uniref:Lipoprotein n=2 Tax=Haliangium ochraceum TaxID=80816 RepID=D0LI88_HALO1|nr:hypothetical protein Hoch_3968 [Haliangium ochraceum DSM 14365]
MPLLAGLLMLALLGGGCGGAGQGPEATLDAYRTALVNKEYGTAYELMSAEFRARHTRQEFEQMVADNADEVRDTVAQLGRGRESVTVQAEVRYGLGEELRMRREADEWRLVSNPLEFYSQATPRDALRSFLRAYRLERWGIMLRFVPERYRERMDAEVLAQQFQGERSEDSAELMRALEANIDAPITDKGDEARMPYGDRHEVTFVREGGQWKILDFD